MLSGWDPAELMSLGIVGLAGLILALDDWRGALLAWALMSAAGGALLRWAANIPGELVEIRVLSSALLMLLFYLTGRRAQTAAPNLLATQPVVHRRFRFLAAIFLYVLARIIAARFPLPLAPASLLIVTYALIGIGLLITTLGRSPLKVGLGVLTMFDGYQIFYLSVQDSLLAIGLMGTMGLLIAFLTAALTLVRREVSA